MSIKKMNSANVFDDLTKKWKGIPQDFPIYLELDNTEMQKNTFGNVRIWNSASIEEKSFEDMRETVRSLRSHLFDLEKFAFNSEWVKAKDVLASTSKQIIPASKMTHDQMAEMETDDLIESILLDAEPDEISERLNAIEDKDSSLESWSRIWKNLITVDVVMIEQPVRQSRSSFSEISVQGSGDGFDTFSFGDVHIVSKQGDDCGVFREPLYYKFEGTKIASASSLIAGNCVDQPSTVETAVTFFCGGSAMSGGMFGAELREARPEAALGVDADPGACYMLVFGQPNAVETAVASIRGGAVMSGGMCGAELRGVRPTVAPQANLKWNTH
jgi:hypothetical protein